MKLFVLALAIVCSLTAFAQPRTAPAEKIFGVVTGVVTDNKHPDGAYRVKVKFPSLPQDASSTWARVSAPNGPQSTGLYTLPEVGDEVLVAFVHGDIRHPIVLGTLWNK